MKYDFETLTDRTAQGAGKWLLMKQADPNVPDGIVPFSVADMEFSMAPEIIHGLKTYLNHTILGYPTAQQNYFDAIMHYMKRRHNWDVKQEWICPAPGVLPAIFTLLKSLSDPGDGVIIQTPVYYPFYNGITFTGRTQVHNPLLCADGHYTMDYADLEKKCKDPKNKILVFCSPHNPVGRVWSREELEKMARICLDNDVIIISDEIHFDIVMPGYEHTVLASISEELAENVITCTAPSKSFNLAGAKAANIMVPKQSWREKFWEERLTTNDKTINTLGYEACRLAYTQCDAWLDELLVTLEENRRFLTEFIERELPRIKLTRLEGTYLQWMDFRGFGMDAAQVDREMIEKAHLFLDDGAVFGEAGTGFQRINFACPKPVLVAGLLRLKDWADAL